MSNLTLDEELPVLWRFARGHTPASEFESWVYASARLEESIGSELYLAWISVDYRHADSVESFRRRVADWLLDQSPQRCQCITLRDLAVVDMGSDSLRVFSTFTEEQTRGNPYWWLWIATCNQCGDRWLIGSEERQNDVYCMRRLSCAELSTIQQESVWPPDFDNYETLLAMGRDFGKSVRWLDPLDSSLTEIIADLAEQRPGIAVSELAGLLNLSIQLASSLAKTVAAERGVTITFTH